MCVMSDQRNHKRLKLNFLAINATLMFSIKVKVVDISISGISLESNKPLGIGNRCALRMTDRRRTVSLKGNVVWSSLVESRKDLCGNVIPVYKTGMNFIDMSAEKGTEILNFIKENDGSYVCETPVAVSKSNSEFPGIRLDEVEHMHKRHESGGYHRSLGITEYAGNRQIEEAHHELAREFQHDPTSTTCDLSLMRLIVPRQVPATAGKAVLLYARAVAFSKAGEVPVTVTLHAVPVADVKVGIYPASITKEVAGPTNFCFSSRIVCAKRGTWPVKWTAKITFLNDSNTSKDVLTGITHFVCRNAELHDG